jgi:hypothetical protein
MNGQIREQFSSWLTRNCDISAPGGGAAGIGAAVAASRTVPTDVAVPGSGRAAGAKRSVVAVAIAQPAVTDERSRMVAP